MQYSLLSKQRNAFLCFLRLEPKALFRSRKTVRIARQWILLKAHTNVFTYGKYILPAACTAACAELCLLKMGRNV